MNKEKAIKWIIDTKAISPFTRNFIEWLYDNGGRIVLEHEIKANPYMGLTKKELREKLRKYFKDKDITIRVQRNR